MSEFELNSMCSGLKVPASLTQKILKLFEATGIVYSATDISVILDAPTDTVRSLLARLCKDGSIERVGHGLYARLVRGGTHERLRSSM